MPFDPIANFDLGRIPDTAREESFHADATYVFDHLSGHVVPGINAALSWMNSALPGETGDIFDQLSALNVAERIRVDNTPTASLAYDIPAGAVGFELVFRDAACSVAAGVVELEFGSNGAAGAFYGGNYVRQTYLARGSGGNAITGSHSHSRVHLSNAAQAYSAYSEFRSYGEWRFSGLRGNPGFIRGLGRRAGINQGNTEYELLSDSVQIYNDGSLANVNAIRILPSAGSIQNLHLDLRWDY